MNRSKIISIILVLAGIILIFLGLNYSLEALDLLRINIMLLLSGIGLFFLFFISFFEFVNLYFLVLGYLLLFFSFSTALYGLKVKISDYWRYISFITSEMFGFILFFLDLTIYDTPSNYDSIISMPIVSIILIITGPLILIWGLKEKWDKIWKYMSIITTEIIGVLVILLGFIIYNNSISKGNLFSAPSLPEINIATFLFISGILMNLGVSFLLSFNIGYKIRNINLIFLLISSICSQIFLLLGSTNFIFEFVGLNIFELFKTSLTSSYLILSITFSGAYIFFLVIMKEFLFQITSQIKSLDKDEPIQKLSEITPEEIQSLNNIDIFTIFDLANEEDLEEVAKITKIKLKRIEFLKDLANNSLLK